MKSIILSISIIFICNISFAQIQTHIKPPDQENTPVEKVPTEEEPNFTLVECMPHWQGCENTKDEEDRSRCTFSNIQQYLAKNIIYPNSAKNNNITGIVYVTFVLDTKGMVKDARVLRGVSPELDEEALRVISSMPQWIPGTQKGKTVKVQYNIPIKFSLSSK